MTPITEEELDAMEANYCDGSTPLSNVPGDIKSLIDALRESRERQRWIPVAEKLPAEDERVLVMCQCKGCEPYFDSARFQDRSWCNDNWHRDLPLDQNYVTHWMVPPAVPE